MKKQDGYYVKSREIDLKRMLWWIARQWRKLLILAVVCASVMAAWKYNNDYKSHQEAYRAALNADEEKKTVESVSSLLTMEEYLGVQNAIYYYEMKEAAAEYLNDSILMHLNPYDMDVAYIYYELEDADKVSEKLEQFINSKVFLQKLNASLDWNTEEKYLLELFEVSGSENQIVVTARARTQEECIVLAENAMEIIASDFSETMNDSYYVLGTAVDLDIVSAYSDINEQKESYIIIFNSYQSGFTANQDALFTLQLAEKEGVDIYETEEEIVPVLEETHISRKMLLLGALAGILVGVAGLAILYVFSVKIHGTTEIAHLFAIPIMGNVNIVGLKKRKILSVFDKWLDRIVYGKDAKISYEQQVQIIVSNIFIACKTREAKTVLLAGSEIEHLPEVLIQDMKTALGKKEIDLIVGKSIAYDAETLLKAEETGNVVLIETDEVSKCEDIVKELNSCLQNQIRNLGVIMVQY